MIERETRNPLQESLAEVDVVLAESNGKLDPRRIDTLSFKMGHIRSHRGEDKNIDAIIEELDKWREKLKEPSSDAESESKAFNEINMLFSQLKSKFNILQLI